MATADEVLQARYGIPLEPLHGDEDDEQGAGRRARWLAITDEGFGRVEDAATLETLLSRLGHRDREVLRLRFGEDLKQSEIAARIGASQVQVSRAIRRATTWLREAPGAAALG